MKKDELAQILLDLNVDQKEVDQMGRVGMIGKIRELSVGSVVDQAVMETEETVAVPVIKTSTDVQELVESIPTEQSPVWTEYVLKMLRKDELIEGHPSADGLRRVCKGFVDIISSTVDVLQTPVVMNDNRATVKFVIKYVRHDDADKIIREVSDVADCYQGNTKEPYYKFPTATASTTAEGRCLRKILGIKVITAEESQSPDKASSDLFQQASSESLPINPTQMKAISIMIKTLGINASKFTKFYSKEFNDKDTIEALSYTEAQEAMRLLNAMKRGPSNEGIAIPEDLYNKVEV